MSLLFIRPKLQVREGQHGCNAQNPTVLTFWPPGDPPREPSIKTRYRKYMFSIHNTVIVKETSTRSCPRNKSDYFIANLAGSHFCCFSVNFVFLYIKPLLYFLHNTWFQNSPICFNMKCYMHLQKLDLGKKTRTCSGPVGIFCSLYDINKRCSLFFSRLYHVQEHYSFQTTYLQPKI